MKKAMNALTARFAGWVKSFQGILFTVMTKAVAGGFVLFFFAWWKTIWKGVP